MSSLRENYEKYKPYVWIIGALLVGAFILNPILGGGCPEIVAVG